MDSCLVALKRNPAGILAGGDQLGSIWPYCVAELDAKKINVLDAGPRADSFRQTRSHFSFKVSALANPTYAGPGSIWSGWITVPPVQVHPLPIDVHRSSYLLDSCCWQNESVQRSLDRPLV